MFFVLIPSVQCGFRDTFGDISSTLWQNCSAFPTTSLLAGWSTISSSCCLVFLADNARLQILFLLHWILRWLLVCQNWGCTLDMQWHPVTGVSVNFSHYLEDSESGKYLLHSRWLGCRALEWFIALFWDLDPHEALWLPCFI